MLCFLVTFVLRLALLPNYRQVKFSSTTFNAMDENTCYIDKIDTIWTRFLGILYV